MCIVECFLAQVTCNLDNQMFTLDATEAITSLEIEVFVYYSYVF